MDNEVIKIPASRDINSHKELTEEKPKRRVAAYVRVSTSSLKQIHSADVQKKHYYDLINSNPDWELHEVYADVGITGTMKQKREGFNKMLQDAQEKKFDLLLTKSVSRFARNTVDSITTIRLLKDLEIEVYFERENIRTFEMAGEFLITILSAYAQEESMSISKNTQWGMRRLMARGKGCVTYSLLLGYDKDEDNWLKVNEQGAKIVRRIYEDCINGFTSTEIVKRLEADNIPTSTGGVKWGMGTILSILRNEKYKGDLLLQKYYKDGPFSKKIRRNHGELPQFYKKNNHKAIVDNRTWNIAQLELKRNKFSRANNKFRGLMICGKCSNLYGAIVHHSNDIRYRKIVFRCSNRYRTGCNNIKVGDEIINNIFNHGCEWLFQQKEKLVSELPDKFKKCSDLDFDGALISDDELKEAYEAYLLYNILTDPNLEEFKKSGRFPARILNNILVMPDGIIRFEFLTGICYEENCYSYQKIYRRVKR